MTPEDYERIGREWMQHYGVKYGMLMLGRKPHCKVDMRTMHPYFSAILESDIHESLSDLQGSIGRIIAEMRRIVA